jgi:hypothetical protein
MSRSAPVGSIADALLGERDRLEEMLAVATPDAPPIAEEIAVTPADAPLFRDAPPAGTGERLVLRTQRDLCQRIERRNCPVLISRRKTRIWRRRERLRELKR